MLGVSMNVWIKQRGKILIQDFQAKRILSLKPEQICIVLGQDRREGHIGWNSKLNQLKRVNYTWKVISVNKSRVFLKGKKCSWKRTLSKKKQLCQRVIHKCRSFVWYQCYRWFRVKKCSAIIWKFSPNMEEKTIFEDWFSHILCQLLSVS